MRSQEDLYRDAVGDVYARAAAQSEVVLHRFNGGTHGAEPQGDLISVGTTERRRRV